MPSLTDLLTRKTKLEDDLAWERRVQVVGATADTREAAREKAVALNRELFEVLGAISNRTHAAQKRAVGVLKVAAAVSALVVVAGIMAWRSGLLPL